jgi:hypothetical protein
VGSQRQYPPHKLLAAVIFSPEYSALEAVRAVEGLFGPVDLQSAVIPFTFTRYYEPEMGGDLQRLLLSFERLVDPGDLSEFKRLTNDLEHTSSRPDGSRRVNLDPGLLSLSRVVLATTKPSSHRLPIGDGIYGEVTLLYRRGRYEPLEWTYPDFRSGVYEEWLQEVRRRYQEQLHALDSDRHWRL